MPIYDPSTHDDLIDIDITLASLASGQASFSTILMLCANVTPGNTTHATYNNYAEVVADIGELNTTVQEMARIAFAQANPPSSIIIRGVDVAGAQTYVQALDAAIASGLDFYGVIADVRTPATQILLATDIENKASSGTYLLFITQDDDADWKTTGLPAAWAAVADYERTVICYHDDNDADATSDYLDVALAADRLSWDADETSVGWTCAVAEVDALTTPVTSTQKGFLRTNAANVALPMGTLTDTYVDPGQNLASRPIDHIVSADWLRARISEAVADLLVSTAARGVKITVDVQGQTQVANVIEGVFLKGLRAGHILAYELTPVTITAADITAQRVRFTGEAQFSTGIRQVGIDLNLSATALT